LAVLVVAIVVTPLSVVWGWPEGVSAALLFLVILLLLLTGQTVIFLLRLVAAERRAVGRRRPLSSPTRTVGELEDERRQATVAASDPESEALNLDAAASPGSGSASPDDGPDEQGRVRQ
jgi:hypothetical protein